MKLFLQPGQPRVLNESSGQLSAPEGENSTRVVVLGAGFGGLTLLPEVLLSRRGQHHLAAGGATRQLGVELDRAEMAGNVAYLIEPDLATGGAAPRPAFSLLGQGQHGRSDAPAAVAEIKQLKLSGRLAWLSTHLIFLLDVRNKLAVLLQWAYAYCTYKRGARIITGAASSHRNHRSDRSHAELTHLPL